MSCECGGLIKLSLGRSFLSGKSMNKRQGAQAVARRRCSWNTGNAEVCRVGCRSEREVWVLNGKELECNMSLDNRKVPTI